MSPNLALYLIPILNTTSILDRTLLNYLADKLGRIDIMFPMTLLSAILILALWLPAHDRVSTVTFVALFGITSGAVVRLGPILVLLSRRRRRSAFGWGRH
ncbi:hypothetical protein BBP40_007047 [Aspergillus hancockii]|nr:hypothetical protein BBP40_007047 [Aspergillus hancockii]